MRPADFQLIEQLDGDSVALIRDASRAGLTATWPAPWHALAVARIALAKQHLAAARALLRVRPSFDGTLRSAISRAYYAMFAAGRAIVSLDRNGDVNDHRKLPEQLAKSAVGAQTERADVVAQLNRWRALRNNADYSVLPTSEQQAKEAVRCAVRVVRFADSNVKLIIRSRST